MSSKIIEHPTIGRVEIRSSSRARRISIGVTPSGAVRLIVPILASTKSAIAFMESKKEWIKETQEKFKIKNERQKQECKAVVTSKTTLEEVKKLHREAIDYLPKRTLEIARDNSIVYKDLRIGKAKSRWGSCRTDNRITFTIFIMGLPKHLIDYIIIHELCHTIHHNHSPKFHELVNKLTNNKEKTLDKELKQWRICIL